MSSNEARRDFPDQDQRAAFCNSRWEEAEKSVIKVRITSDDRKGC